MALARDIVQAGLSGGTANAIQGSVKSSISAAGTVITDATDLTASFNMLSTVADGAGVVTSQFLASGDTQSVFNAGANALKVYPTSGMKINSLPANQPMLLPTSTGCLLKCVSTTRIFGILSA